jgi:uncharacterized phage protein gp47/JayE
MAIKQRTLGEMTSDAINYLSNNTSITYLEQGSTARALIDATLLEVARLQDFVITNYENSFLSNAKGPYLDVIGNGFGIARKSTGRARVSSEDGAIRFYVRTGTLGQRLRHPSDPTKGLIPANTTITNPDGTVQYFTTEDTTFPVNLRSVYVDAVSSISGTQGNIGVNQLTINSLNNSEIFSTNDITIAVGEDQESDDQYRLRIAKAFTTKFSATSASIQLAANAVPGVSRSDLYQFARGAGTYDLLLVPRGNKVSKITRDQALRALESVTAYGVSARVREPNYVSIALSARLRFDATAEDGERNAIKDIVQSAVLSYLGNIPLGGELIINQLRANILGVSPKVIDVTILELCIDGRNRVIRNYRLEADELLIPSEDSDPIQIL